MLADQILFIDAEALVIDKPAGLPVTLPRDESLSVENHLESMRFGFVRRPTIVHRLDRDTSGCLLLARNPRAHRKYSQAFEAGEVIKTYLAVIDGVPAESTGICYLALAKVSTAEAGWRMVPDKKKGKAATTAWEVLAVADGRALVRFSPKTGRTHQLRVHAASGLGVPIMGDPVYGKSAKGGMMLHASTLEVPRAGKESVKAHSPLPARFTALGFAEPVAPVAEDLAPGTGDGEG